MVNKSRKKKFNDFVNFVEDNPNYYVDFACYADPPVPCIPGVQSNYTTTTKPVVILTKDWQIPKNNTEVIVDDTVFKSKNSCVGKSFKYSCDDKGGLIVFGKIKLDSMIDIEDWKYTISPRLGSLCAGTRHDIAKTKEMIYCKNVELIGFITQYLGGGCNPGGHIYFPFLEKLNDTIYRNNLAKKEEKIKNMLYRFAPKMNDKVFFSHFPDATDKNNRILRKMEDFIA